MHSDRPFAVLFYIALLGIFSFSSCKKDEPSYPTGSDEAINQWIGQQMDQYYYWRADLPKSPNLQADPSDFFYGLLNRQDRFSSIVQSSNTDTYTRSLINTFGFDFMQIEQLGQVQTIINHVVPNSAGDQQGLSRGDKLQQINGQRLTTVNLAQLVAAALTKNEIALVLEDGDELTLPASYVSQPVLYNYKVFDKGDQIGYLFLSYFDFSGGYDLLAAAANMKKANINSLILDLRYNPGGQVSFAAFCALLFAHVQATDSFVQYKGNNKMATLNESFADALARQPDGYSFTPEEIKKNALDLSRIYVLTSEHTASAAEMLINNLQPYIDIVHIGNTTMGKDMASVTLTSPATINGMQASWQMLPLVYKIYNSNNKGDYPTGLVPAYSVNEYEGFVLYPLGDEKDPLIAQALHKQMGNVAKSSTKQMPRRSTYLLFESAKDQGKPIIIGKDE